MNVSNRGNPRGSAQEAPSRSAGTRWRGRHRSGPPTPLHTLRGALASSVDSVLPANRGPQGDELLLLWTRKVQAVLLTPSQVLSSLFVKAAWGPLERSGAAPGIPPPPLGSLLPQDRTRALYLLPSLPTSPRRHVLG